MRRESTIRKEIYPKKHVSIVSSNNYSSIDSLVSEAEEFAKEYGRDLDSVYLEARITNDGWGGGDYVEIELSMEIDKTQEEIEEEVQKRISQQEDQKNKRLQEYKKLQKEFGKTREMNI
jgi:hypothetical protein